LIPLRIREIVPPLIAMVFVVATVGLMFELVIAGFGGRRVDPVATPVLGTIIGACVPALVALYVNETRRGPPSTDPPPPLRRGGFERTGDEESDQWNEEHGWLQFGARGGRWITP
jgi:hypothetical protein